MPVVGSGGGAAAAAASSVYRKRPPIDTSDAPATTGKRKSLEPPPEYKFSWVARACRQEALRKGYKNPNVQWAIAGLIIGNFSTNIVEKQIDPTGLVYAGEWTVIEFIWNSIFVLELIWNMTAHWAITTWSWRETSPPYKEKIPHFFCSSWNLFDFVVVGVSVPSLLGIDLGSFSQLRMLRAFRVFRLFKRIKSLNKIIVALINAIPGVSNAFMIMIIFMSIYAILAVDFFRDFGEGYEDYGGRNAYTTLQGNSIEGALQTNVSAMTARGYTIGDEYYGTFTRALYTLFQVMTGESWSEAIARPLVFGWNGPYGSIVVGIYYVSFILLTQIVLVNVVVAVLLDKFVEEVPKGEEEEEDDDEEGEPAETSTASVKSVPTRLFQGSAAAEAAMPDSNVAELSARVRGVEAKLDQVLDLLKALDKRGGPSA